MLKKLRNKWVISAIVALLVLSVAGAAVAQSNIASFGSLSHHLVPNRIGAGVQVDCGGEYPGIRGLYICNLTQSGNTITVTRQVADSNAPRGVATETFTFSLAGGQADGVVTAGAFSANNQTLNLTVTAGGTSSTVAIPVPAAVRAGPRSFGSGTPGDVVTGTGSAGTNATVSRFDHTHGGDRQRTLSSNTPQNVASGTGSAGSSSSVSRADHVHGGASAGSGDITSVTAGNGLSGGGVSGDVALAAAFASTIPDPVGTVIGQPGTDNEVSRADHRHQLAQFQRLPVASDDQIARWDASSSSWAAEDLPSGTGTGDITSITTPTGSGIGLTGCDTGDCAIALDIPDMTSVGLNLITSADEIILLESGLHRRTTLGNISQFTFGRIANQTDVPALANADSFVVNDASEGSSDPREVTAAGISNYVGNRLAGGGLTYDSTNNELDFSGNFLNLSDTPAAFGTAGQVLAVNTSEDGLVFGSVSSGTGDISAVNTSATSGLSGGVASGSANLATDWERLTVYDSSSEDTGAGDDLLNLYIDDGDGQRRMTVSVFGDEYAGAFDFTDLGETPNSITANECLQGNAGADALIFGSCGGAATGDITSVVAGEGLSGGGTTGDVTLNVQTPITWVDSDSQITYTAADTNIVTSRFTGSTVYTADLDVTGTADADIGDLFLFQWRGSPPTGADTREVGIRVNGSDALPVRVIDPNTTRLATQEIGMLTRYSLYYVLRVDGAFLALGANDLSKLATVAENASATFTGLTDTPASITANMCAQGNAAGTAIVFGACGSSSGSTTFTGLSDTPNAYTSAGGDLVRVNSGATALEFFAEPTNQNTIPHVGRIPAVTPTSPDLIFLTHDEVGGSREDATFTIARDGGNSCGYSDGSIYMPAFGDIDEPSPITSIFGIWNSTDSNCDLSEVYSTNEGWLDDQAMIVGEVSGTAFSCDLGVRFQRNGQFVKRFTSCSALEDLALGDITINFLDSSSPAVAYWNDGEILNLAGLYEKVGTPPAYHDIRPIEESHRRGQGSFACGESEPPDDGGQVCIDSDGRASFSTDRSILFTVEPEITTTTPFMSDYWQGASNNVIGFNNTGENGEFKFYLAGEVFFQIQGVRATGVITVSATANADIPIGTLFDRDGVATTMLRTTAAATVPANGSVNIPVEAVSPGATGNNIPNTATFTLEEAITGVSDSATVQTAFSGGTGEGLVTPSWEELWTWITGIDGSDTPQQQAIHNALAANSVFLGEFSQQQHAAEDRDGFTGTTTRYFFILHGDEDTLQEITGFTAGMSQIRDDHHWVGPVITIEDVHDVFEANSGAEVTEVLDDFRVGDTVYSVLVRPGANGELRTPTSADYDATYARSRTVAVVDGQPYKVRRTLVAGHSATGTFTEVVENTRLPAGGSGTFRWRGVDTADQNVSHPEEDDIYYNIQYHHWRVRDHDPVYGNYWYTLPNGGEILTRLNWVGYYDSEADALGHATATGQRFVITDSRGSALYTLATFTAGDPDHYEYSWTEANPVPGLPANDILIDDLEVTFNAADRPSIQVQLSRELLEVDDGRAIVIDYRPNASGGNNRAAGGVIFAEHVRHLTTLRPVALQKVNPFGGRDPIDHTEDLPTAADRRSPGHVEFPFPLSTGDNDLHWMRLIYIGDHIDDMDGAFGSSATTITVNNPAGIPVNRNYWIVGPVSGGGGCAESYHSEKVTVTAVGTPNPDDLTVVRGLDGTGLANNCQWVSGADIILDDKITFILAATHDDQDSGNFTFTLMSQGVGAAAGTGMGGGGEGDLTGIDAGVGIAVADGDTPTPEVSVDLTAVAATHDTPTRADRVLVEAAGVESISTIGQIFGAMQTPRIYTSGVTYGGTNNSEITIADADYTPSAGDMVLFQHNTGDDDNYANAITTTLRMSVGTESNIRTRIADISDGALRDIRMNDLSRYEWMGFLRAGSFWHLMFRTYRTP